MLFVRQQLFWNCQFLIKEQTEISILKLSSRNLNWNQLSLARAKKASCVQTLACLNTLILLQNYLDSIQNTFQLSFVHLTSSIHSAGDKHFIKHVSSHKTKTRLNFILWLTDRQMTRDRGIFPLPLIDSLWPLNERQKRRNHGDVFVWEWMKGKTISEKFVTLRKLLCGW